MSKRARITLLVAIACLLLALLICLVAQSRPPDGPSPPNTSSYPTSTQSPLQKLAALPVKGRAPKTGYSRDLFGAPWSDDVTVEGGHNGCDTRNDILQRDLAGPGLLPGSSCIVISGVLNDPYTGQALVYQTGSAALIDIDHVVTLSDAWQKGAQIWDDLTRRNFANDPLNLQTTTTDANRRKGSSDAATWLPDTADYRCTYATRIVDVKTRYRLWVTTDERETLEYLLRQCSRGASSSLSPLPSSGSPATSSRSTMTYRVPPPRPRPCYRNVNGDCIRLPGNAIFPPPGANALCRDDSYSFSAHRRGSCARHGGVSAWLD